MIVSCEECTTSFQLDESRIPADGIRVRCSRCKHAFFLPHPSASQSEAVDAAASEAVKDERPSTPSANHDLSQGPVSSAAGFDEVPAGTDEEESDWEFNEEVPTPADDDSEADLGQIGDESETADEPLFDGQDISLADANSDASFESADYSPGRDTQAGQGSGIELADGGGSEPASDLSGDPPADSNERSDFGSVDDFSSLMAEDDLPLEPEAVEDSASALRAQRDSGGTDTRYVAGGESEDLGDPESWDFFTEQGGAPPVHEIENAPLAAASPEALQDDFDEESVGFDPSEYSAGASEPGVIRRGLAIAGQAVCWTGVVAMLGYGLAMGLAPSFGVIAQEPAILSLGTVKAEATDSYWLDTASAGPVLVIEGEVWAVTAGGSVGAPPIRVSLLDSRGARVAGAMASVGDRLPERGLREWSVERLEGERLRAVQEFERTPVEPGAAVSFAAIFRDVPTSARRFLLEKGEVSLSPRPEPDLQRPVDLEGGGGELEGEWGTGPETGTHSEASGAV